MFAAGSRQWIVCALLVLYLAVRADQADGQAQRSQSAPGIARSFHVPPAPALSPQEEMKTFRIAPGYHLQLVASEPLVHDPVAMSFDSGGRIWVCEMRGFMPNVDGKGEREPVGTISVLEDSDGDGVMDRSTVFLDKLVMPRAVCWTTDGILVAENGKIWHCRDSTGGLHCDQKTLVCEYNVGNLEHALNGLVPMLDNWIYAAKEGIRLRKIDGKWVRDTIAPRGQWGITQDDHGYLVYNVNAQLLRGDLVPCYSPNSAVVNPYINVAFFKEQQVWPIRPNTGINRGYIASWLRADGSMIEANADCGPVVYRGDNLPRELLGNVFINEPAGNLVRRQVFYEENGTRSSQNAYDKTEFIASTDERFRPVNMYNAPDGTLYMIDMYRGVIQHAAFITPYLRKESLDRGLEKPIGLGRIFRIVHDTTQQRAPVRMSRMSSAQLVEVLSSPNGWQRDMAQQLLVQRGDISVVPALRKLATTGAEPLGRLHALWVLEGLRKLDPPLLTTCMADADGNVRASSVCLARNFAITVPTGPLVTRMIDLARRDRDKIVRMQLVFALGLVNSADADQAIDPVLKDAATDPAFLEALLAGFAGHEVEFLSARLASPAWENDEPWRKQLLKLSAGLLYRQRQPPSVLQLLQLVGTRSESQAWQQVALLEGLASPPPFPRSARGTAVFGVSIPRVLRLPAAPESLEKLRKSPEPKRAAAAEKATARLNWPGKDGLPLALPPPLTAQQQELYDVGKKEFLAICAACHNPSGFGEAGKGPPLIESDWLDRDERVIRLVLLGMRGPITINGQTFNRESVVEMPGMYAVLDDQKIAGVLTFVRREWREKSSPIEPATVARIRAALGGRTDQWTEKELLEVK